MVTVCRCDVCVLGMAMATAEEEEVCGEREQVNAASYFGMQKL
jgi:hypothetical protein